MRICKVKTALLSPLYKPQIENTSDFRANNTESDVNLLLGNKRLSHGDHVSTEHNKQRTFQLIELSLCKSPTEALASGRTREDGEGPVQVLFTSVRIFTSRPDVLHHEQGSSESRTSCGLVALLSASLTKWNDPLRLRALVAALNGCSPSDRTLTKHNLG